MVAFLLTLMLAARGAAEITVNAAVDRTSVALDGQIVLEVTVAGPNASLPEPQIPQMPNFSVYSRGRSQSLSFINGQVESSVVHTYVLVPRFVGKGSIPPVSVSEAGRTIATEPIEIVVERPGSGGGAVGRADPRAGRAPPRAGGGGGPEMFLTAELDKPRAFVDEQVTLTVRFHTAVGLLGNPHYTAPKLTGFLAEDLPPERHGRVNARGRQYYYSEIRTALFPQQSGRASIGPAQVRVQVQESAAVDPFAPDFFDRFFSQGLAAARPRELASEPLALAVEALPEAGRPASFSGAVGRYSVSAAVDRAQVKAGEAVNLVVTVKGTGNLKAVAAPAMPELPSFRVFDTVSSLSLEKKDGRVEGSKVFKTVLVPRVSGELEIPALEFAYFDPAKRAYVSARSAPIKIKAAPGDASAPVGFAAPAPEAARGLSAVSQDIRYLKLKPARRPAGRALEAVAGAGLLHALPFVVLAWTLGMEARRRAEERDPARRRRRQALKRALERAEAGKLAEALHGWLEDVLGRPAGGLTAKKAQEALRAARPSVSDAALGELREVWDELDRMRFSPAGAAESTDAAARLAALLRRLEGELK